MFIALRDARQGQDGARPDFDDENFHTEAADLQDGAHGHEHLRASEYLKNHYEAVQQKVVSHG